MLSLNFLLHRNQSVTRCSLLALRVAKLACKGLAPSRIFRYLADSCPCWAHTCDMTIMLPSSARRMSLGRYPRLRSKDSGRSTISEENAGSVLKNM